MMDDKEFLDWDDNDDDVTVAPPPTFGSGRSIVDDVSDTDTSIEPYDNSGGFFSPPSVLSVSEDEENPEDSDKLSIVQRDTEGNTTRTVIDFSSPPLTKDEAQALTENIRSVTNVLYILMKRAHAGKAWKALGYNSFKDYVKEEFQISRSYAYKLLDQATVIESIQAVTPEGTEVYVSENASRTLKGSLPELLPEIERRSEGLSPEEASDIVRDVIDAEQHPNDDPFGDGFALEEPPYDDEDGQGGYQGNGQGGEYQGGDRQYKNPYDDGSNSFDFDGEEDYYEEDSLEDGEDDSDADSDTAYRVQKLEKLYNFITTLRTMGEYAEYYNMEELFESLPEDREADITQLLTIDIDWLTDVKSRWDTYLENKPQTASTYLDDDEDDD